MNQSTSSSSLPERYTLGFSPVLGLFIMFGYLAIFRLDLGREFPTVPLILFTVLVAAFLTAIVIIQLRSRRAWSRSVATAAIAFSVAASFLVTRLL